MIKKISSLLLAVGCCISLMPSAVIADSAPALPEVPAAVKVNIPSNSDKAHMDYAFEGAFIYFHANGGAGKMERITADLDQEVELTKNAFKRRGYKFIGWNTQPDGSGVEYENGAFIIASGNMDLYAQWKNVSAISITAPSKTVKKIKPSVKIKVKVRKGNKPLKKKIITLKVAKKTYRKKTNNKGVVVFKIKVRNNKKLKVGKNKYTVKYSYKKISKTIKVKR